LSDESHSRAVWLPGPADFPRLHADEMPQKDGLCGPFWVSLALRARGVGAVDGAEVGQDLVAAAAGSKLASGDPYRWLPQGEEPRTDYLMDLPVVDEADGGSGTSAVGLMRAVETLGGEALACVPVAGPWRESDVESLFEAPVADPTAILVANVRTGAFVGSHPHPAALVRAAAGDPTALPERDWDVGHFVNPMLYLEAPEGALVLVRDTYRSLGVAGHHWQTAESLAAALRRGDGSQGGVLTLCSPGARASIEQRLESSGMRVEPWDNGTRD
jgi:hypothetical protein